MRRSILLIALTLPATVPFLLLFYEPLFNEWLHPLVWSESSGLDPAIVEDRRDLVLFVVCTPLVLLCALIPLFARGPRVLRAIPLVANGMSLGFMVTMTLFYACWKLG